MSGDFDFFTNDDQPKTRPKASPRAEPRKRDDDDRGERSRDIDADRDVDQRPSRGRNNRSRLRDDGDDRPQDRRDRQASIPRKGMSPLLIGGIALGGLLVVGGGVAIIIAARGTNPERKEKPGTPPASVSTNRPASTTPPKRDPIDANSPSPEVVDKVKKATVRVRVAYKNGKGATGSGFVEKESRLVLTNAHVVGMMDPADKGPAAIELVVNSGEGEKEYRLGGELLSVDKENDLALIRPFIIEVGERHIVPEGLVVPRNSSVALTQKLFVFGFPLGEALGAEISVRPTTVTSLRKNKIQVEGGMTSGNSGGPVVDLKGNVVGIAVSVIKGEAISFAIPGEMAQQLLVKQRK